MIKTLSSAFPGIMKETNIKVEIQLTPRVTETSQNEFASLVPDKIV